MLYCPFYVVDNVPAYEKVWFFRDNFGYHTYSQYFHNKPISDYGTYIKKNYDTVGFLNDKYNCHDDSAVSRIRNLLPSAVKSHLLLPKLIVVVTDDDLMSYVRYKCWTFVSAMEAIVKWLMSEYRKVVDAYKDYLQTKSKRQNWPFFIWIEAPYHTNFNNNRDHERYNKMLVQTAKDYENVAVLALKKVWDPENRNLFIKEQCRFTAERLSMYWEVVDSTVRYTDTMIVQKKELKTQKANDRYHWSAGKRASTVSGKGRRDDGDHN